MKISYSGKTVLVTGGGRGIGLELSKQLIAKGAQVLAIGRDEVPLRRMAQGNPGKFHYLVADLADPAMPLAIANWVAAEHPGCSILINNAAIMEHVDLSKNPHGHLDRIETEIRINLIAPLQLAVALLPTLGRHQAAVICNVTSGLAISPIKEAATYCATKAGLRQFTKALRYQIEDAGLPIHLADCQMTLVGTSLSRGAPDRKYPAKQAAADLLAGLAKGQKEIAIEKVKLLRLMHRISPAGADRLMRAM